MTTEQVTLAEQIGAVQRALKLIRNVETPFTARDKEALDAAAASLQQLEPAMAALRPFAEIADAYAAAEGREDWKPHSDWHRVIIGLGECRAARTALDDAAIAAATPAGKGEGI